MCTETNVIKINIFLYRGLGHAGSLTNSIETRYSNSIIGAGLNSISIPIRKKQRRLIRNNPRVLIAISKGMKIAIDECQYQFKDRRWNCPTLDYLKGRGIFGKIVRKGKFCLLHFFFSLFLCFFFPFSPFNITFYTFTCLSTSFKLIAN